MASRFIRILVVTVVGGLGSLGACTCEPPPAAAVPRIAATYPGGSNTVQSDGTSVAWVSLHATTADGTGDTSPISVSAPSGAVAAHDATDFSSSLSGNPNADGALDFDFICDFRAAGAVALTVQNSSVTTTITVRCVEPRGDTVIVVDDSACDDFAADGESACRVGVTVEQRASVTIPLPGTLEAAVIGATPLDPGTSSRVQVLSADGTATPSDRVTVTIDDEGHGEYWLHAPSVAETVQVELASSGVTITREHEIAAFVNQAAVSFPNGGLTVAGGASGELLIDVTNPRGQDADSAADPDDVLEVTIEGGDAATRPTLSGGTQGPGEALTGVAVSGGQVSMTVQTQAVTEIQVYTVTVRYQPLQSLDPIEAQVSVTVNPPGTLILDVSATPTTIHSDTLTPSDLFADIAVDLTVDGAAAPGGTVTLSIPSDSSARLAFVGSDSIAEVPEDDARNYTMGVSGTGSGSVQVEVTRNVPTGVARIIAVGSDNGGNSVQREIVINIERAPILQAIVFGTATPAAIGVQGGSMPSSTVVSFVLYDDAGRIMPNVGVSFSSNATADRGITVTANAVSDSAGTVVTVLSAGTIPGPVTVRVSAESGLIGTDGSPILRTSQSNPIPVVGGLPSFETSAFQCGPTGVAAVYEPYAVTCKATLVDKFSNVIPNLLVQFSAEAADEASAEATAEGTAEVVVASNEELRPRADLLGWSYGLAIPNTAGQMVGTTFSASDANACFDDLITTPCDLVKLCEDTSTQTQAFCPLPENDGLCFTSGVGLDAGVLTASALLDDGTLTPLTAATTRAGEIAAYVDSYRSCGFPVSCLRGRRFGLGLDVVAGDYCPVNPGCMDFTPTTECPQDSMRTVMAAVRGAEAFSDLNGNGIYDNGIDAFVDMPEPFLDRNDNCFRDDLTNATRFQYRPIEKVRNTDQFYDVNGDEEFGFLTDEHNGVWDFDTQIFLTDKILEIGDAHLEVGEVCPTAGATHNCADGGTSRCIETALGEKFAPDCGIPEFSNTASPGVVREHELAFRWTDGNGNCPSVNFGDSSSIAAVGFVNSTGALFSELDYDQCSFAEQLNPMLPYCTSVPFSGSPLQVVTIIEDCAQASQVFSQITLNFLLDGGTGRTGPENEELATTLTCN
ncbi:MAG: hypothetical protein IT383_14790 [Deltaproteobacteria bacterium]|nr:hypothetical protein [Deltaproteobacteria bacterium]